MPHTVIPLRDVGAMLWPSIRPLRRYLFLFPLLAFVTTALMLAEPFLYGSLIDTMISVAARGLSTEQGFALLSPFLFIWVALVVAETLFGAIYTYAAWHFGNIWQGTFMQVLYERLLQLDVRRFHEERAGEMLRRFDNTWDAAWNTNSFLLRNVLTGGFTVVLSIGIGLAIDWRLTLIALLPLPIMIGMGLYNLVKTEKQQHEAHKLWENISGHTGDSFANIATVKAFAGEKRLTKRFGMLFREALAIQMNVNKKWAITETGFGSVYLLGRLMIFLFGSWFVLSEDVTIGTLIMFLGFSTYLFTSVQQILTALPEISRHFIRIRRTASLWYEVPDIREKPGAVALRRSRGEVRFDHVSYAYRSGYIAVRDVSLTIEPGKTYALVGGSGAGKSTISQMLLRFYDPTEGRVLVDGHDLRDIRLGDLRRNVGFVMQENPLFNDTIINNIRFGKPNASERMVIEAAKRAQAHEFIMALKEGYNSMVGERGLKLSGGQKQRIALARMLLANPPILVLDEATSALDSKTEHDLQIALKEVMKNRTTLVIAHRLSTVMSADQILVLERGQIVDQGRHEDLIKRGGLYKQYWEIQAGGYV